MGAKDSQLQIRVTAGQKAAIKQAAARANMDVSRWVLARLLPDGAEKFRALTDALGGDREADGYALAELNDFLTGLGGAAFVVAVEAAPRALAASLANYVAAMIETAAHAKGVPPPEWTAAVAPLPEPQFGTDLLSLRLHLLLSSPPAFRRRNIFVDPSVGSRV